jgi:hypothetical protein
MIVFIRVWPVLKSLPATGTPFCAASSSRAGKSTERLGAPLAYGTPSLRPRRRRACWARRPRRPRRWRLEGLQRLVRRRLLDEHLGGAAPDHHQPLAAVSLLEVADVLAQRLGPGALAGAGLHVRSLQLLHVALVEHRRHRLDPHQEVGDRLDVLVPVEHAGLERALVGVRRESGPRRRTPGRRAPPGGRSP